MQDALARWLYDPVIGKIVTSAVALIVIVVVIRLVNRWVGRFIKDNEVRYRARKVITFLGYIAAVLTIAAVFSNQFRALTVAFGVAGAGVAFALQEVIFGNFFRVGDRIQLGGIRGDVIDVGVLRSTLMECGQWVNGDLYNGRIVRVANSFVFKEPVVNYSTDFPFLWDEFTIAIRHGSDHRLVREILERLLREIVGEYAEYAKQSWKVMVAKYRIEDARIEPMVSMVANENWMEFTARYVVDYRQRRGTKDRIFTRLVDELADVGGKVALASTSLEIVEPSIVDVRLLEATRPSSS
jgi:small-conductance mechanosensitive channel